jgi:hypothetical protein
MAPTDSIDLQRRARKGAAAFLLPLASACLGVALPPGAHAAPAHAGASASAASSAATSTKDSRALLNERLRKCKVMSGDEKTACEKDAHSAAAGEARKESGATHK